MLNHSNNPLRRLSGHRYSVTTLSGSGLQVIVGSARDVLAIKESLNEVESFGSLGRNRALSFDGVLQGILEIL